MSACTGFHTFHPGAHLEVTDLLVCHSRGIGSSVLVVYSLNLGVIGKLLSPVLGTGAFPSQAAGLAKYGMVMLTCWYSWILELSRTISKSEIREKHSVAVH